jgi:hypothetical protein
MTHVKIMMNGHMPHCMPFESMVKIKKVKIRVRVIGFRTLDLGISRLNHIWVQPPWPCIENTMKGKVVASPNSGLW